ncbi:MAG: NAD(P)H-hydrate dehydratase [Oscillospiraceae bacterium]|nr:NAD(P)H-hydrate dehydratase [Oscillospiraceae bacterium]
MRLLTAAQMKEIDRVAIQERGIPSTLLMERAAQGVVRQVMALAEGAGRRAAVFCGPGNHRGDGGAPARRRGVEGGGGGGGGGGRRGERAEDCREMERRLREAGGQLEDFGEEPPVEEFDAAVDALFGIGLNSPLRPEAARAAAWMNRLGRVVSADIPSGVHADTGQVLGCAVKAAVTVTFSAGKPGLFVGGGAVHSGRVVVEDIGIPEDLLALPCQAQVTEKPSLPRRARDAHKGDFGRLLIVAGSVGYTGAPILASWAAVRSGAGLVTLAVPKSIYPMTAVRCEEAMAIPLPERPEALLERAAGCDGMLLGPGLGQGERAEALMLALLKGLEKPVIVDADGLNILSRHIDVLDNRSAATILTPHDGEFARLSGCPLPIENRLQAARDFAQAHRCILVLKGHRTITAFPDGLCAVNPTGNPGMARGGAGDALAGLLAGLWVQLPREQTVPTAVWLHGRAGDLAARDRGEYGMTIGDLLDRLPDAMKECEEAP